MLKESRIEEKIDWGKRRFLWWCWAARRRTWWSALPVVAWDRRRSRGQPCQHLDRATLPWRAIWVTGFAWLENSCNLDIRPKERRKVGRFQTGRAGNNRDRRRPDRNDCHRSSTFRMKTIYIYICKFFMLWRNVGGKKNATSQLKDLLWTQLIDSSLGCRRQSGTQFLDLGGFASDRLVEFFEKSTLAWTNRTFKDTESKKEMLLQWASRQVPMTSNVPKFS